MKHGVSLLEVLISIFAISVGMMGIAALIPVGQFSVIEATKADRSAACGRAAMAEVKVRNLLDPAMFLNPSTAPAPVADMSGLPNLGSAFVIDPFFSAQHVGDTSIWKFPYDGDNVAVGPPPPPLYRVTLRQAPGVASAMPLSVADRIFTWRDDLIFDADPGNPLQRPRQSYLWDSDATAPAPTLPTDDNPPAAMDSRVQPNLKGDYTWLLTVTPAATEINPATPAVNKRKFDVSVVVIFKRDSSHNPKDPKPSERPTNFLGATALGFGGGDLLLIAPKDATPEYLDVRQNEWMMLTGMVVDSRFDSSPDAGDGRRRIAKWYRVVAVEDVDTSTSPLTRRVTLAGPDWTAVSAQAVLIDGVVGVYTKTIELDRDSKWNK